MRVHHIGYLVKKIEKARDSFKVIGFTTASDIVYDRYRDVDILFMEKDGYTIELVSPKSDASVVAKLIKTFKNAPYHICYESGNFEQDIRLLGESGFLGIDSPAPAPALNDRRVQFFMNPRIGLVEILEGDTICL